ncbi:MAG: DUF2255 family protein [Ignavibacteriae bacterium]|jgi:hypothetical protein|nr:DUF2255 family protein [Ignavibacteriota bacterium]NOG97477.1 DUF2255 family protein [Ignavibacteriota bacterium]
MNCENKFPKDFYKYLEENTLVGIKGGKKRNKYLEIWMVNVNGRIFARTWTRSKKSWFNSLLEEGIGEIKYSNKIIEVSASKNNEPEINMLIDKAYLQKYDQPNNVEYSEGITKKEYWEYTVELFYNSE